MTNKVEMIDLLTGVKSSKKSYYTELKKTVLELQKKNMQLEIINEVTKSFNIDTDMGVMLQNILLKLNQIFLIDRLYVATLERDELILTHVYPENELTLPRLTYFPNGNSLFRTVLEIKEPIIKTLEYSEVPFFEQSSLKQLGAQTMILYPLVCKGRMIGVFSLESKHQTNYQQEDYAFFQQLTDQLATCIENARLYNSVLNGKKQWEETFRSVSSMIFVIHHKETISLINDAVKQFFNLEEQVIYQHTFHQLVEIDSQISPLTEAFQTRQVTTKQIKIRNRICEIICYPSFNEGNELTEVIVYINDVTEKLQIEAQLIHSGKLAAIGEMAAGVAHELNNPLTAVLGNSQLLLRTTSKEKTEYQLLEDIHQCGIRCKHIIRSLLTFSRQDEYVFQECSLNQAVEQVLHLIRYQIEKQNIKLNLHLDETLPTINGSLQQIEQIAINLLLNAKQAFEEDDFSAKTILVETYEDIYNDRESVCLSISDNGTGMEKSIIQDIFNPFFTTKKAIKGSGLGLSVSLGIAKSHGGTIEVISELGKGSKFILILPKKGGESLYEAQTSNTNNR